MNATLSAQAEAWEDEGAVSGNGQTKLAAAEDFTAALAQIYIGAGRLTAWADAQGIPAALGLTPEEWARRRLGEPLKLALTERQRASWKLVAPKAEGGLDVGTTRAAKLLGVTPQTVRNDYTAMEAKHLAARGAPPEGTETVPAKNFARRRPAKSHRSAHLERLAAFQATVHTDDLSQLRYDHIIAADALTYLKSLPEAIAHCCITSPPYWAKREYTGDARELGREATPAEYVERLVVIINEIGRVLIPGAYLFLVLGDTYASEPGQFRGGPHQGLSGLAQQANGTALTNRQLDVASKSLCLVPERLAVRLVLKDGWRLANRIAWVKEGAPPENVQDRLSQAWEPILVLTKAEHAFLDRKAVLDGGTTDVWRTRVGRGAAAAGHYAPFPDAVVERAINAGCPPGGTVLDPFVGSGTTMQVAHKLGRRFLGCDLAGAPHA